MVYLGINLVAGGRRVLVLCPMLRMLSLLMLVGLLGLDAGCSTSSDHRLTGAVRYFNIRTDVAPRHLIVQIGDEIRWQNLNAHAVRLRMLAETNPDLIACDKGFSQFGILQDSVTIAPLQSVSLCFSKPTTVRFNVWLEADNPQGAITPTGSIRIEPSRSKRSS